MSLRKESFRADQSAENGCRSYGVPLYFQGSNPRDEASSRRPSLNLPQFWSKSKFENSTRALMPLSLANIPLRHIVKRFNPGKVNLKESCSGQFFIFLVKIFN